MKSAFGRLPWIEQILMNQTACKLKSSVQFLRSPYLCARSPFTRRMLLRGGDSMSQLFHAFLNRHKLAIFLGMHYRPMVRVLNGITDENHSSSNVSGWLQPVHGGYPTNQKRRQLRDD